MSLGQAKLINGIAECLIFKKVLIALLVSTVVACGSKDKQGDTPPASSKPQSPNTGSGLVDPKDLTQAEALVLFCMRQAKSVDLANQKCREMTKFERHFSGCYKGTLMTWVWKIVGNSFIDVTDNNKIKTFAISDFHAELGEEEDYSDLRQKVTGTFQIFDADGSNPERPLALKTLNLYHVKRFTVDGNNWENSFLSYCGCETPLP